MLNIPVKVAQLCNYACVLFLVRTEGFWGQGLRISLTHPHDFLKA
jgi:hypothetical protein